MTVCHRAHHGTDGQAVEVVINKDQDAKQDRRKLCAAACLDMRLCPAAERGGSAGFVHEGYDGAKHDQKHQDANVVGIRYRRNDSIRKDIIQRPRKASVRRQDSTYGDSDEQGRIHFLGDQGKDNRHE